MLLLVILGTAPVVFADKHSRERATVEGIKKEVTSAAKAIKNYKADRRFEATNKVSAALNSIDTRIYSMEARIDRNCNNTDMTSRKKARRTLNILHRQRVRVAEKYGGLKYYSSESWELMKKSFLDSYKKLLIVWEKAENEY